MGNNPEIGQSILTSGYETNYHDMGEGQPLILLHGSGPGVSGWANWRGVLPALSQRFRVLAPDLVGFGYTAEPDDFQYRFMDSWVEQISAFIEALQLDKVCLVGNSFGGAVALAVTIARPDLVDRLVLMGAVGVPGVMTKELDQIWGYTPSFEAMKNMLDVMAFNRAIVTDDLAELRYQASLREGVQTRYERLFPAPRQRWLDAAAQDYSAISAIKAPTLLLHGRDDRVIPLEMSLRMHQLIANSQLHVFGNCGHWTQIEQADRFIRLVSDFALGDL
jgi:2-hydroxymuconate-semialdehyde hydrolase